MQNITFIVKRLSRAGHLVDDEAVSFLDAIEVDHAQNKVVNLTDANHGAWSCRLMLALRSGNLQAKAAGEGGLQPRVSRPMERRHYISDRSRQNC